MVWNIDATEKSIKYFEGNRVTKRKKKIEKKTNEM